MQRNPKMSASFVAFRDNRKQRFFAGACPELVEGAQNDIFGLNCLIDEQKSLYLLIFRFPKNEIPFDSVAKDRPRSLP